MSLVLLVGAILVAYLIFVLLLRVARAAVGPAIAITLIVLVLLAFGIAPIQLRQEVVRLFDSIWRLITGR